MAVKQREPRTRRTLVVTSARCGLALSVLGALLGCPAWSTRPLPSPMLSRADAAKPEPVDVAELRARYSEGPELRARCEAEAPLERALALRESAHWSALQELSANWLEQCPIDIDFHRLRAQALGALERKQESSEHMRWYRELLGAALSSGDGTSPETAYVVASKQEEHALMRALEVAPLRQLWVRDGLHAFEVRNTSGQTYTLYFNPSTRMSRLFREAPLDEEPDAAP